jgi:hypothetical protein
MKLYIILTLAALLSIVLVLQNADALCLATCQADLAKETPAKPEVKNQTNNSVTKSGSTIKSYKVASLVATGKITKTYGNFITIELSQTCLTQLKNNVTTKCPSYKDLQKFDTTDPRNAGKFESDKKGFYHRGKPLYNNYQLSYHPTKFPIVVCIDCSEQIMRTSKNIVIEAVNFVFKNNKDHLIKNFTRYEYSNRDVKDCMTARISYSPALLNDTIYYLASNCKDTKLNMTKSIYMTPKPIGDRMQYKAYQYQKSLQDKIKEAQELAKAYCNRNGSKC